MRGDRFYANPRLTALFVLFIVVLGGMAFSGLARQEDPTMTERWAGINTFLPVCVAALLSMGRNHTSKTGVGTRVKNRKEMRWKGEILRKVKPLK